MVSCCKYIVKETKIANFILNTEKNNANAELNSELHKLLVINHTMLHSLAKGASLLVSHFLGLILVIGRSIGIYSCTHGTMLA
jgi:hypothetical protein